MSFLKYQVAGDRTDKNVYFNRADRDGAPFRGTQIPLLKDQEFEELTRRVCDARWGLFDTTQPDMRMPPNVENGRTYTEVLDGITAGWFELLCPRQYKWGKGSAGEPKMFIYVEWAEPYRELIQQAVSRIG